MTIDAKNSVRIANSIIRNYTRPQGIVSDEAGGRQRRYDGRLFFCSNLLPESKSLGHNRRSLLAIEKPDRNVVCKRPENVENFRISLAFRALIYYNNVLYNVVGPRLMQGLAKLRKVAEVFEVGFNYLKLPHIANSQRTLLAT